MKQLRLRLERGLMFVTVFLPLIAILAHKFFVWEPFGTLWFAAQTLLVSLLALLPAFVGNYTETEIIRYEGGALHGSDPNPDRESRHETIKEGHRFPLRFTADMLTASATLIALLFLPQRLFADGSMVFKFAFAGVAIILELVGMATIAQSFCVWTELPGVLVGFISYLSLAVFLRFSKADNGTLNTIAGIGSLVYVFMGGVCLNRQSLTTGPDDRKAPANVVRRNRVIVLSFSAFAALTSFVEPIRKGAAWLFNRLLQAVRLLGRLLRGGGAYEGDTTAYIEMTQGGMLEQAADTAEESYAGVTEFEKILVIGFFVLVGLCFIWVLYDRLKKLMKKLTELMERFARSVNEGYYDERENLAEAAEARKKLKDLLREKVKNLFTFETPWDKLDGRGKAIRLVRDLYKKRLRRVPRARTLTAREALGKMELKGTTACRAADAYDRAKYSSHEVDSAEMDRLRKDI